MHHALLISEISREICGVLDQSSLPAVARTCCALHDPALDELWRDLYSIYPFMHLLTQARLGESQQVRLNPLPFVYTNLHSALPVDFCSVSNFAAVDHLAQILGTHPIALHVHDRRCTLFRPILMSLQPSRSRFLFPKLANHCMVSRQSPGNASLSPPPMWTRINLAFC